MYNIIFSNPLHYMGMLWKNDLHLEVFTRNTDKQRNKLEWDMNRR